MEKNKFRTRSSGSMRFPTEAGSEYATTYEIELDEKNHKTLVATGKTHTYADIQSHLEETKIENILARALLGDDEALHRVEGRYIDTTEMPKTLAEAQNMIIKLTNEFEALPLEQRRAFNFSVEEYIAKFGTEEWATTMGYTKEEPVVEVATETLGEGAAENE